MDSEDRRSAVWSFIVRHFDDHDLDRCFRQGDLLGNRQITSYDEFSKYQEEEVAKLSDHELLFAELVMENMERFRLCDKEAMCPQRVDGFIFMNGNIIITRPR